MNARQWAIMVGTMLMAGLGVYVGADLEAAAWVELTTPHYILGSAMASISALVAFLSKPPAK